MNKRKAEQKHIYRSYLIKQAIDSKQEQTDVLKANYLFIIHGMSIMDHDPKYEKLRQWRYRRMIDRWHESIRNSQMFKMLPRIPRADVSVHKWKPITTFREDA